MRILSIVLMVGLALNSVAIADTAPPSTFVLTPDNIRTQLLSSNLGIMDALDAVHDAKDKFNVARGNLLPSLNLSATFQPSFLLSSIETLVPFLLPSTWFDMYQARDLFEAQKISYRILELNTYSSALSMYFPLLADYQNRLIYEKEAQDFKAISDSIAFRVRRGLDDQTNADHALAQAEAAEAQAHKMVELNDQEIASMREALSLPLNTDIQFDESALGMPPSDAEGQDLATVVYNLLHAPAEKFPEKAQIEWLKRAAENATWSETFAFITGASLSAASTPRKCSDPNNASTCTPAQSASFSDLSPKASVGLGFGTFPAYELSNRNQQEVTRRELELTQETTRVLESTMKSLDEAKIQLGHWQKNVAGMNDIYLSNLQKYQVGLGQWIDVLNSRIELSTGQVSLNEAMLDVNLLRVTLHRTLLTDQFAKIKGCVIDKVPARGLFDWIGGLFGADHYTLDQVCKEGGSRLPDSSNSSLQ